MDPGYQGYVTTWLPFLVLLAGYIGISLAIGGKKAYFEPFQGEESSDTAGSAEGQQ
jgi:hypothetical protein